jgi:DNA mismatch endonuclease (patch repair protein)
MSKEARSGVMASIRGRDTGPERLLRRTLWAIGVRGWRCHWRISNGWIDIAFPGRRVAIFVDGSFWHGHPSKWQPGRWKGYWDEKIRRNVERDRARDVALSAEGWTVLRFWDFEINDEPEEIARRIAAALEAARETPKGGS